MYLNLLCEKKYMNQFFFMHPVRLKEKCG